MLESSKNKWYGGRWSNRFFTWTHALATLALDLTEAILLILAYVQMNAEVFFVPVYIVFSTVWMLVSFLFIPPVDGGMAPNTLWLFLAGLAMGGFWRLVHERCRVCEHVRCVELAGDEPGFPPAV